MLNINQTKNEALGIINAALAILNKFPQLNEADFALDANFSLNPFPFLLELLKTTAGYNAVIELVSKWIATCLPVAEAAMKVYLITQLKDILSCSVNPFFTKEILRDGVTFNIREIDLMGTLCYCPLDGAVGKNFYFGTEGMLIDDLPRCDDMDALIWFMINRANDRYVWKIKKNRLTQALYDFKSYEDENGKIKEGVKAKKSDGILTFEYYENSINVRDAYGNDMFLKRPYRNCLHVFIGDARVTSAVTNNLREHEENLLKQENAIIDNTNDLEELTWELSDIDYLIDETEQQLANNEITQEEYESKIKIYKEQKKKKKKEISKTKNALAEAYGFKKNIQYEIGKDVKELGVALREGLGDISPLDMFLKKDSNYYFGHTIIEFNIDYIMSLKFFDEKTLTARLIDSLVGALSIDLSLSYQQQLVRNEVRKMVSMVIEGDDVTVSDCFFTFSNDDYNTMSEQAELRKAGLLSMDGEENNVQIDVENLMASLNEITPDASKETVQTVIEGALREISGDINEVTPGVITDGFDYNFNFLEKLLNNLCFALVSTVLSPKVILLLMINLKIMGKEHDFNLEEFIGKYKQLIIGLISMIKDMLLDWLVKELMKIVGMLAKEIATKLAVEQAMYFKRLIDKLIACFKSNRGILDFNLDKVNYADILPSEEEPADAEC